MSVMGEVISLWTPRSAKNASRGHTPWVIQQSMRNGQVYLRVSPQPNKTSPWALFPLKEIVQSKYSETCHKPPLKNRQNKGLKAMWWLNAGRKYCRMLPLEHSAILLTCIKR